MSRGEFECRGNHEHGWLNADDSPVEIFLCSHQGDGRPESVEIQYVLQKVVVPRSEEIRRGTRSCECVEDVYVIPLDESFPITRGISLSKPMLSSIKS